MNIQIEHARLLNSLHIKGNPLILFNIWDAGSAKAVQEMGAKVIATSSWSVASSQGYEDGEKLPFEYALENLKRIIASVNLPVTIDLEGGYGETPIAIQETVMKIISAGAVGINFEDQNIAKQSLYSIEEQCARIKAIRDIANHMSVPLFINARTDLFLNTESNNHDEKLLEAALQRTKVYAEVGANGFFVPGLCNTKHIENLCARSALPINIMVLPDMPSPSQLAELGIARISYGPTPYALAMNALKEAGKELTHAQH